jgi:hypothetical protein
LSTTWQRKPIHKTLLFIMPCVQFGLLKDIIRLVINKCLLLFSPLLALFATNLVWVTCAWCYWAFASFVKSRAGERHTRLRSLNENRPTLTLYYVLRLQNASIKYYNTSRFTMLSLHYFSFLVFPVVALLKIPNRESALIAFPSIRTVYRATINVLNFTTIVILTFTFCII